MNLSLEDLRHSDIYLVDQIFKGRIHAQHRILDVGCGSGRNLIPLAKMGCEVYGIDLNPNGIMHCSRNLINFKTEHFFTGDLINSPFPEQHFDTVICNALFHFASSREQFINWADRIWKHLKPGGLFFARLSTTIGLPEAQPPGFTFLANEEDLINRETRWQARRVDPLKTTLVEKDRTMTTWVLQK